MPDHLVRRYTENDLERARTKAQLIGWAQGGGVTFAVLLVIGLIGWIPGIVLGLLLGFVAWKLLRR
jgi:hypothetical protein